MDALYEILRSFRLTGGIFLDARFTAPWCVASKITPEDCKPLIATPAQVIAYHYVIDGELVVSVDGESPVKVSAGEIVLLPRNDGHTLSSGSTSRAVLADDLIQPAADGGLARISWGGGGEVTHLVCGFLGSGEARNPLILALPKVMKLDVRQGMSREWVEASVRFAADELVEGRLASSTVMSRLSELLFVEAVRSYAETLKQNATGWLKGLSDPQIGRALAAMHRNISAPWSVESLAREAALSRSTFVERFTSLVGMPPMRYLTVSRLEAAKLMLRETRKPVAQLGYEVGYESNESFCRAFRREFGTPPARWREISAG